MTSFLREEITVGGVKTVYLTAGSGERTDRYKTSLLPRSAPKELRATIAVAGSLGVVD